jgi:S-(hydroxymethyl)glutathione dehydrogenase/alcohol dehydrogenase
MLSEAAVFDGRELRLVADLDVPEPGPGQVTVRLLASGICHSDLNVLDGTVPVPPPVVLGHEGAGIVEIVGEAVTDWTVGDAVVISGLLGCGHCRSCRNGHPAACAQAFASRGPALRWQGSPVRTYANVSSFSQRTTVAADQLVGTAGLAPTEACLIGCALATGFGVVNNVAKVRAGDRVAVFGIGGIGAAVVQSACLAGADVTAVDVNSGRETMARQFGASAFTAPGQLNGTFDAVFECSGSPAAIAAAIDRTAAGGTTALVGLPPTGARASFDVGMLMRGQRIAGSLSGDIVPSRDLPLIAEHLRAGRLDAGGLVSRVWPLEEIDAAISAVRRGEVIRAVLDLR